jgi:hypothetical protein
VAVSVNTAVANGLNTRLSPLAMGSVYGNAGLAADPGVPSLALDFSQPLPSSVTFTRADATTCATYFDAQGVLRTAAANIPRIDYDPATLVCKGLLIEESRANLCLQSGWAGGTSGTEGSGAVAPTSWIFPANTGQVTYAALADSGNSIRFVATAQRPMVGQTIAITSGNTYTVSCYVVQNTGASPLTAFIEIAAGTSTVGAASYTVNGVTALGSAVPVAGDRITIFKACTVSGNCEVRLGLGVVGAATGDITLKWPQLELGSFPTSYIPTTTASVTRASDVCSMTGTNFSSWFNASEGTFVVVAVQGPNDGTNTRRMIDVNDGSASNRFTVCRATTGLIQIISTVAGGSDFAPTAVGAPALGTTIKAATAFASSYKAISLNGAAIVSSAVSPPLAGLTQISIGNSFNAAATTCHNSHIRSLRYYPKRLSDATLRALTL